MKGSDGVVTLGLEEGRKPLDHKGLLWKLFQLFIYDLCLSHKADLQLRFAVLQVFAQMFNLLSYSSSLSEYWC